MTFLTILWNKFQGWILGMGAIAGLLLGVYLKGRNDQSDATASKENKKRIEDLKTSKEIEDNVSKMPKSDLDRKLDRWLRD